MKNLPLLALFVSLGAGQIAHAQTQPEIPKPDATADATAPDPAAGDVPSAIAPGTTPIQEGAGTIGTQGIGGVAGGSPLELVPVPDVADAGLADARNNASASAPILTLEQAVVDALQNNPTPQAARAAVEAALARAGTAASAGKLQGNLGGQIQYQKVYGRPNFGGGGVIIGGTGTGTNTGTGTGTGTGANTAVAGGSSGTSSTNKQLSLNVSLPIYSGGRVKNSRRAAQAAARAAVFTSQQTEQELAAQTIIAYLGVLRGQELLTVAESNLDTSRERRRISEVRFDAGAAARLEVLNADAELAASQQNRIQASNSLAQSKAAVNILLARPPETPLRVETIDDLSLPSIALPAVARFPLAEQATAIANGGAIPASADLRAVVSQDLPSLLATQENITASEYNVKAQKSQRNPNVGLSLTGLLRDPVGAIGRTILGAGVSLAQTLFDGGRISSQVREANASLDQARLGFVGQQLQVANAIEGSLLTLDSARKKLASTDTAILSAQEALRAAQLAFTAGAGTQFDVSNAQNALLQAQTNAVNARFDVAQAQVQLAAATAITAGGSATGASGLGTGAGTGQSGSFLTTGATQNAGVNGGRTTTTGGSVFNGNSTGVTTGIGSTGLNSGVGTGVGTGIGTGVGTGLNGGFGG